MANRTNYSKLYKREEVRQAQRVERTARPARQKPPAASKTMRGTHWNTPEVRRARKLRQKYGMTPHDYEQMLISQEFRCAICFAHQSDLSEKLLVDHDHGEGRVRGLLCRTCNAGLGQFKDDVARLASAVVYLTGAPVQF